MEPEDDRVRELVGHIMRLMSEVGALNDSKPALSPLNLDDLEGSLREVKERNQRLREECEQVKTRRKEKETAVSVNSIVCDVSGKEDKEEEGERGKEEEKSIMSRESVQERRRQENENSALEAIWEKAVHYWPEHADTITSSSTCDVSDHHGD